MLLQLFLNSFLLFICMDLHLSLSGTLVVMIPTKEGIVVAADSRTTIKGKYYDFVQKLNFVSECNILFTITGTSTFIPAPPNEVNMEEWIQNAQPSFDGDEILKEYLQKNKIKFLDDALLKELSKTLVESLINFFLKSPNLLAQFKGKELCRVVLAQYLSEKKSSIFGTFLISISKNGIVKANSHSIEKYQLDDEVTYRAYGEDEYLISQVIRGKGRQFLTPDFFNILKRSAKISDLSVPDGAFLAYSLISASSKIAKIVPPPSGIGGKITVLLINDNLQTGYKELKLNTDFK